MAAVSTASAINNTGKYLTRYTPEGDNMRDFTTCKKLIDWVEEKKKLCQPIKLVVVDGTEQMKNELLELMISQGKLTKLNPEKRPNSYLALSDPKDVARVEKDTYICSMKKDDAGPINNWVEPKEMRATMDKLYNGCMKGRIMYVIPYSMGPHKSPLSENGIQLSDNPYVVLSMITMTRVSLQVLRAIEEQNGRFVPGMQSAGVPLEPGQQDVVWPCGNVKRITHFPETREILTYGSSYGGNALLGKKCFALRIASVIGRDEGWLAEHMLIIGVTNPQGVKRYFAAAFPSQCGKTNMAMMIPTLPGWKVETVGDDIAWMKYGEDGRLYAINPENGMFGVAPGTSHKTNHNAMESCAHDALFTNVGLTSDNDVWWEGMTDVPPTGMKDWNGLDYDVKTRDPKTAPAAQKNSRFCVPLANCPVVDPAWDDPKGVPISAIFLGGRRPTTIPLVYEAKNWESGVFIGSALSSESTAAAQDANGGHDPFAMRPFCGYHMADYWAHWLDMGRDNGVNINPVGVKKVLPKIYGVNWFRSNKAGGKPIWPGFGDNCRVLAWAFQRCDEADAGRVGAGETAVETPIGFVPKELNLSGLNLSDAELQKLMEVNPNEWADEVVDLEKYYNFVGMDRVPNELKQILANLKAQFKH